jgi:hypothetical protein
MKLAPVTVLLALVACHENSAAPDAFPEAPPLEPDAAEASATVPDATADSGLLLDAAQTAEGGNRKRGPSTMKEGMVTASGTLTVETIQRVVRPNKARFMRCYEDGLNNHPDMTGSVQINFIIGRDGHVETAHDGGSHPMDASVVKCMRDVFMTLVFPLPGTALVHVAYPMAFQPGAVSPAH